MLLLAAFRGRPMAAVARAASTASACDDKEFFKRRLTRLRIALVRHGESMNNVAEADGVYESQRVADPPLSERGVKQAAALGAFVGDAARTARAGVPTRLYSPFFEFLILRRTSASRPWTRFGCRPTGGR